MIRKIKSIKVKFDRVVLHLYVSWTIWAGFKEEEIKDYISSFKW